MHRGRLLGKFHRVRTDLRDRATMMPCDDFERHIHVGRSLHIPQTDIVKGAAAVSVMGFIRTKQCAGCSASWLRCSRAHYRVGDAAYSRVSAHVQTGIDPPYLDD